MNNDEDLPVSFDLLVWGPQHPRVVAALSRASLPPGVRVFTDKPLKPKRLREEWASAVRTRKIAQPLTRRTSSAEIELGFVHAWWVDEF